MNRLIKLSQLLFIGASILILNSCEDYKGQIAEKQSTIDSLQNEYDELLEAKILLEQKASQLESEIYVLNKKYEKRSTADKDAAIAAIKYQLKMYHPDVRYRAIRAVAKTDGSVDVILDIIDHFNSNKYYNVTTYSDGSYRINKNWGVVF